MKKTLLVATLSLVTTLAVMPFAMADGAGTSRTAVGDIKWGKTPFGPDAAAVSGDFTKGKHISLIRFPAGMKTPLHTHTYDYVGIVITGKARHYEPGKPETETVLEPGSHWFIKGGVPHISECLAGQDCIFALYQDDAFDFLPAK